MSETKQYCLDSNIFIQGWNTYYAPELCPSYWDVLDNLAATGVIFAPIEVKREIEKIQDSLHGWLKGRSYFFRDIDLEVQIVLRDILHNFERLVDTKKERSMADPWVIAHAKVSGAIVVTKESYSTSPTNIKIPNVCEALDVPWMNDFQFCREVGIRFEARKIEI